jgi:hypothetical protein
MGSRLEQVQFAQAASFEAPLAEGALEMRFPPEAGTHFGAGLKGEVQLSGLGMGDFGVEILTEQMLKAFRVHGVAS